MKLTKRMRDRRAEFLKVGSVYREYETKIKIIKPNGETNWIDIENFELDQIRDFLLSG